MAERLNDGARAVLGWWLGALAWVLEGLYWLRAHSMPWRQARLRRTMGITPSTPVRRFGEGMEAEIAAARASLGKDVALAVTSGSVHESKRILYSRRRLLGVRLAFFDGYTRAFAHLGIRRRSLFVLAPPAEDGSLTSLLLKEPRMPPWTSTLVAPYRVQSAPPIRAAAARHGEAAVRALLLTVSDPGVLYATNPSTLALFFEELARDWAAFVRLSTEAEALGSPLRRVLLRIAARGWVERLALVRQHDRPLPAERLFPSLEAFICWDGGYVRPFLERLWRHLNPNRVRHLPMFSMSTEVVETLPAMARDAQGRPELGFVPLAPGVLYEFLEEGATERVENLLCSTQLEPGKSYAMVVSDRYGLKRYHTEDLFLCTRRVGSLPDLRFLRRTNLSFSFTGEKLTGEQLALVFREVGVELPEVARSGFLSFFPCRGDSERRPHYKLVWAGADPPSAETQHRLVERVESRLSLVNPEFRAKRTSGRLGETRLVLTSVEELVRRAGGKVEQRGWEAQFKFLPLYPRPWEEPASATSVVGPTVVPGAQ